MIWLALLVAVTVPVALSLNSPLLAWRQPVYVVAGVAGVIGMTVMLIQPLLISGDLPGLTPRRSRNVHRVLGGGLIAAILVHVGGLWVTSPPDVVDALLFRSPAPFAAWGVVAMWAAFGAGAVAAMRHKLRLSPRQFRGLHSLLAAIVVVGTIVHAVLILGTMEQVSKVLLAICVVLAFARVAFKLKVWRVK